MNIYSYKLHFTCKQLLSKQLRIHVRQLKPHQADASHSSGASHSSDQIGGKVAKWQSGKVAKWQNVANTRNFQKPALTIYHVIVT